MIFVYQNIYIIWWKFLNITKNNTNKSFLKSGIERPDDLKIYIEDDIVFLLALTIIRYIF